MNRRHASSRLEGKEVNHDLKPTRDGMKLPGLGAPERR